MASLKTRARQVRRLVMQPVADTCSSPAGTRSLCFIGWLAPDSIWRPWSNARAAQPGAIRRSPVRRRMLVRRRPTGVMWIQLDREASRMSRTCPACIAKRLTNGVFSMVLTISPQSASRVYVRSTSSSTTAGRPTWAACWPKRNETNNVQTPQRFLMPRIRCGACHRLFPSKSHLCIVARRQLSARAGAAAERRRRFRYTRPKWPEHVDESR